MTRRNGKPRHTDKLVPSSMDNVDLGIAIDQRFLILCDKYERKTGNLLFFPESMNQDVMRWRQLRVRHKQGDYRHTEAELRSMQTVAQWTLDVHNQVCGQSVKKPLQWGREDG